VSFNIFEWQCTNVKHSGGLIASLFLVGLGCLFVWVCFSKTIKRRRLYSPQHELVPLSGIEKFVILLVGLDALYMGLKPLVCQ
jgi:hypothetical protein